MTYMDTRKAEQSNFGCLDVPPPVALPSFQQDTTKKINKEILDYLGVNQFESEKQSDELQNRLKSLRIDTQLISRSPTLFKLPTPPSPDMSKFLESGKACFKLTEGSDFVFSAPETPSKGWRIFAVGTIVAAAALAILVPIVRGVA